MPRTTHPRSRHRHDRAHHRFHTDRVVAKRRAQVRRLVDETGYWGGGDMVGLSPVRLEHYLSASRLSVDERRYDPMGLNRWIWLRVRQLAERRSYLGYERHDCGWTPNWCDYCRPPRTRVRAEVQREAIAAVLERGEGVAEDEL